MKHYLGLGALVFALVLGFQNLWSGLAMQAQPTPQDIYACLQELGVSDLQFLMTSFEKGFNDKRITTDTMLKLCQRLKQSAAPVSLREGILRIIGLSLSEELPVTMLVDKTLEGLTKGVAMDVISDDLVERKATLSEVKALLVSKDITIGQTIRFGMVMLKLTLEAVDMAITEAAGALEDWVRGSQKPEDAVAIKSAIQLRLSRNPTIPPALTTFIDQVVSAIEWSQIAQNTANRIKK